MSWNWHNSFAALLAAIAFVVLLSCGGIEAKRGCSNFGHSCYGGMGKRGSDILAQNEEVLQDVQQPEEDPLFVFTGPRSLYHHQQQREQRLSPHQMYNLSPIIRQWLQSYRKAQDESNDGNI